MCIWELGRGRASSVMGEALCLCPILSELLRSLRGFASFHIAWLCHIAYRAFIMFSCFCFETVYPWCDPCSCFGCFTGKGWATSFGAYMYSLESKVDPQRSGHKAGKDPIRPEQWDLYYMGKGFLVENFVPLSSCRLPRVSICLVGEGVVPHMLAFCSMVILTCEINIYGNFDHRY